MKSKCKVGFLGAGNANMALVYWCHKREIPCKVWVLPDHPGALKSVRDNRGTFSAFGKDIEGNEQFPVDEAGSLEELITFSDLLILAVPVHAQHAFVKEFGKFGELLRNKSLLVINGTGFSIRHIFDLKAGFVLETSNSPTASGLTADGNAVYIKDMKREMEVSCMFRLGNSCGGNSSELPYQHLTPPTTGIVNMLNACFDLELLYCTPAEIGSSGINTSLHGVPVAHHLDEIAKYEAYIAGGRKGEAPSPRPEDLFFYRDWVSKRCKEIDLFEEQRNMSAEGLGLDRVRPLLDVLNASYDWNFNTLYSLVVAKICYNEQSLIPQTLDHRFVTEAYVGFNFQAALDKLSGIKTSLAADYVAKFDEFAKKHNRKPFEAYGAELEWLTRKHLVQFGADFSKSTLSRSL